MKFWEAKPKGGRPKKYTADNLRQCCLEYFEWVEDNPLFEGKVFCQQGEIIDAPVPKLRAMTIEGMIVWLGITRKTWHNWRNDEELSPVVDWADEVMRAQKLTGAMAGLLDSNIVARVEGLKDSKEVSGPGGGPIQVDDAKMAAGISSLLARLERERNKTDS